MLTWTYITESAHCGIWLDEPDKARPVVLRSEANDETARMTVAEMDEIATIWLTMRKAQILSTRRVTDFAEDF